jgi:formylglycine-generating enzyme required for sulfatase activity
VRVSNGAGGVNSALATVTVSAVTTPTGFSLIPAGSFTMGDALDGSGDPPHTVNVSTFYMAQNLVTKAQWDTVRTWGISNGYSDLAAGAGKASNHPVQSISWFQMVKWCNARSQQEGLTPVYYTNDAQTTVYKTGDVNVTNVQVKWSANGYRLPTEAEWEKAARGGLSGKRFPWGDTISHSQANYRSFSSYSYDLSGSVNNYHPTYATGSMPYTSPVGSFAANGYGLYDMAGNVLQWCWDWYGTYDTGTPTDPRGVSSGTNRVVRGGSWDYYATGCRVAERRANGQFNPDNSIGFRVARSSVP